MQTDFMERQTRCDNTERREVKMRTGKGRETNREEENRSDSN